MKENKNTTCTPCEERFEQNIGRLVKEGKAPASRERAQKRREAEDAFASANQSQPSPRAEAKRPVRTHATAATTRKK